jgi:hypothetical protein
MSLLRHDELAAARRTHPAWRLLTADNAPLVLGFTSEVFLAPNVRSLPGPEVVEALEDYLGSLRALEPDAYAKSAEAYLADWSRPDAGWMRRYHPPGADVPHYEPTPAVEIAAGFCRDLRPREFVGTASRLLTIRNLLRDLTVGAAADPTERLAALTRRRGELDVAIRAVTEGSDTPMDDTTVRETYAQVVTTARGLLADLRSVEAAMRALDRDVRARVTAWDGPRGELLDTVLGSQEAIGSTDQGKSWQAFWDHLLSATAQAELDALLAAARTIPALNGRTGEGDQLLRRDLYTAASATQATVASLSAQLRRFLDESSAAEERRISELIRQTLTAALEVTRAGVDVRDLASELPDLRADIRLPLERPIYVARLDDEIATVDAEADVAEDLDLTDLLDHTSVDLAVLADAVADSQARRAGSASLGDVITDHPLEQGLAELVGYLQVADEGTVEGQGCEQVSWVDAAGTTRRATLPLIVFGEPYGPVTGGESA